MNLSDEQRISALLETRARTSIKSILSGGKTTFTLTTTLTQTGSILNRVLTVQVAKSKVSFRETFFTMTQSQLYDKG